VPVPGCACAVSVPVLVSVFVSVPVYVSLFLYVTCACLMFSSCDAPHAILHAVIRSWELVGVRVSDVLPAVC
jgi:hypothetical protein